MNQKYDFTTKSLAKMQLLGIIKICFFKNVPTYYLTALQKNVV